MTQKYLKNGGTIALIALLCMTPPLSTDLYMPGLPALTEELGASQTLASFTMTVFFICMAIGMLLLGPLSDRHGRKPVLLCCVGAATCLSLACVFAQNIESLIAFRALQGLGAGGMIAVSTALIKDCFEGRRMATALAVTQAISLIAPIVAPLMGVAILQSFGWRGTFAALAVLMGLSLTGSLLLQETLPREKRLEGSVLQPFRNLGTFARQPIFIGFLTASALVASPYMGYINVSSYIYIDLFGVSENAFGLYFAAASLVAGGGALLYMRFPQTPVAKSLIFTIAITFVCGIGFLAMGSLGPVAFLLCFIPIALLSTFIRPMVTNYLLTKVQENAGAASSLINFLSSAIGCL
ncbi:MAG: MFS transporter, partial [Eggerthellaceae bacterium]|nr:MFS transporter [Eggerthellaceae bacterium]